MDIEEAREILGSRVREDNSLMGLGEYVSWSPKQKDLRLVASLDGRFTAKELIAIGTWMLNQDNKTE